MNRVFAKAINIFFGLFIFTEAVFALSSEYKNSLDKVELTKTKDGSYSVNLYTQKSFNEPVKIIKKNDLSYYILLPETKNSASVISSQKEDIKDVSASMYSYAGADVKNGYTKININNIKNNKETYAYVSDIMAPTIEVKVKPITEILKETENNITNSKNIVINSNEFKELHKEEKVINNNDIKQVKGKSSVNLFSKVFENKK